MGVLLGDSPSRRFRLLKLFAGAVAMGTLGLWASYHTFNAVAYCSHQSRINSAVSFSLSGPTPGTDDVVSFRAARMISGSELLARPIPDIATDGHIPKLIHQSWSSRELPRRLQHWSSTWRVHHPAWEWVLWSDEENRELCKRFFPWFLDTYDGFVGEIFRADAARYMFLFIYGGMYTDLDMECLRPLDTLLNHTTISAAAESAQLVFPHTAASLPSLPLHLIFGQMSDWPEKANSVPNAWIASTPHHPFLLLFLRQISSPSDDPAPEGKTGPSALHRALAEYRETHQDGTNLIQHLLEPPHPSSESLRHLSSLYNVQHDITILPPQIIYPYSWYFFNPACSARYDPKATFNPTLCKEELKVLETGAHAITYWSHSWDRHGSNVATVAVLDNELPT